MQCFVLRAKPFISGGIALMFLCIVFWTHYLSIDLRFHHARISRRFYIRNIRLNGLSTRQAEFRGEAGSLGPWESGEH